MDPGETINVLDMAHLVACIADAKVASMIILASNTFWMLLVCNMTQSVSSTVWCICSQIAFDCGLWDVVGAFYHFLGYVKTDANPDGILELHWIPTDRQEADGFTKALGPILFVKIQELIMG